MLVSKKIRLEVSEQDVPTLEWMQGKCRALYNWWVMGLRNREKWPGWQEAKKTLQASKEYDPELKWVYGKCLAEVYFRLDAAMQAFFRRLKNGEYVHQNRGLVHHASYWRQGQEQAFP